WNEAARLRDQTGARRYSAPRPRRAPTREADIHRSAQRAAFAPSKWIQPNASLVILLISSAQRNPVLGGLRIISLAGPDLYVLQSHLDLDVPEGFRFALPIDFRRISQDVLGGHFARDIGDGTENSTGNLGRVTARPHRQRVVAVVRRRGKIARHICIKF